MAALALPVIIAIYSADRLYQPYAWKRWLASATRTADRVVIDRKTGPGSSGPADVEIVGADKVAALLAAVDFKPNAMSEHCMCYGKCLFHFRRGDQTLLTPSYHHGESFRVHDKNRRMNPNMYLTDASCWGVRIWLAQNGCESVAMDDGS